MEKILFIAGPHGVGKTFLVNKLMDEYSIQHFDTGPIIRELFSQSNHSSIDRWISSGEAEFGLNFTNQILCEEIEKRHDSHARRIIITGNRSLNGIFYEACHFGIEVPNIIYLDANFKLLKQNYEIRENKNLSNEEFLTVLKNEIDQGLHLLRKYVLENEQDCLYTYKDKNDDRGISMVKKRFFQ